MLPLILYVPMATAVAVLLLYALRGIARGWGNGRLVPLAAVLGAALAASLYLMFGSEWPWGRWAAVGVISIVAVPLLGPVTLLLVSLAIAKASGKPIRWN